MSNVTDSGSRSSGQFQQVVAAFLTQPGLPFAGVLSAERGERGFAKHGNLFGVDAIYSTVVMVWSFLGQVLRDGKEASCQAAVILSLATGCAMDLAVGPYSGKETGETALLRSLLESFHSGDLLVADRYYCSFFLIALLQSHGVQVCARMHHKRHVDFRRGRRLGSHDHQIAWTKPARPDWMDAATYDLLPNELVLRELRFSVVVPGRRTQTLTIATTLTDAEPYSKSDIAELYGFRWNAELDIRSIKQSLNLNHVRSASRQRANMCWPRGC